MGSSLVVAGGDRGDVVPVQGAARGLGLPLSAFSAAYHPAAAQQVVLEARQRRARESDSESERGYLLCFNIFSFIILPVFGQCLFRRLRAVCSGVRGGGRRMASRCVTHYSLAVGVWFPQIDRYRHGKERIQGYRRVGGGERQ